jgi:hypothetical protein
MDRHNPSTKPEVPMPMIDVYAKAGTFADPHALATQLAETLMDIEEVPDKHHRQDRAQRTVGHDPGRRGHSG